MSGFSSNNISLAKRPIRTDWGVASGVGQVLYKIWYRIDSELERNSSLQPSLHHHGISPNSTKHFNMCKLPSLSQMYLYHDILIVLFSSFLIHYCFYSWLFITAVVTLNGTHIFVYFKVLFGNYTCILSKLLKRNCLGMILNW